MLEFKLIKFKLRGALLEHKAIRREFANTLIV
jgi:hypothetical protein